MTKCNFCGSSLTDAQYMFVNDCVYKSCPKCSTKAKDHIYYQCPEAFGTTTQRITANNPMGLQSHCSKCRANREGPHQDAFPCSKIKENGGFIINEIRFLPMGHSVFDTYEKVKNFILNIMPSRGGTYYYKKTKMDCSRNTFVLFQYDGQLVGYAICIDNVEFDTPLMFEDGHEYYGYFQFAPNTITLLNNPITQKDFASLDSTFKSFNQSYQRKVVGLLPAIFEIINANGGYTKSIDVNVATPEEIGEFDIPSLKEGAKKTVIVNAYERNVRARIACINYYRKKNNGRLKCEICGFEFGKVYGKKFAEKIHIHHLIEISSIGEEYVIDAVNDLIPICPNCHMIVHSRKPAYSPDEIKDMIGRNSE